MAQRVNILHCLIKQHVYIDRNIKKNMGLKISDHGSLNGKASGINPKVVVSHPTCDETFSASRTLNICQQQTFISQKLMLFLMQS